MVLRLALPAIASTWLLAAPALAVPFDARVRVPAGSEKFLRAPIEVTGVAVEPPASATVEVLPSGEVFVTAADDARGTATVLLAGLDRAVTWELCLESDPAACPAPTDPLAAKSACPDLAHTKEDGDPVWAVNVTTPACYAALRSAFARADVEVKTLRVVLDENAARDLWTKVEQAIARDPETKALRVSWIGPTLVLKGRATRPVVARALLHASKYVVGAISYDDRTEAPPAAPKTPTFTLPGSAPRIPSVPAPGAAPRLP